MKPALTTSICFLLCSHFFAQSITHAWSYGWGSTENDPAPTITVDKEGNVFCASTFDATLDVDPGAGTAIITPTPFTRESYITRFDSAGQFQWVIILRTTSIINIKAILVDPTGSLVCTGDYSGTVDFDPGPGTFNLSSTGTASETFVLKLDLDGHLLWANTTQGTGQKYGSEIATDALGNVYCAGIFTGSGDFDPGPGTEVFTASGFVDGFISKFDTDGHFLWSRHHTGNFQVGIRALETDSQGNVYFGGAFDDRRDFDPGPDSLIITATGAWDAFFQKLDADGNFQWVQTYSNGADNWVFDLRIDSLDDMVITGYYSGTLDFDPGMEESYHTATLFDTYVAKYNANGEWIWDAVFDGTSYDRGNALRLDHNGSIYTTGFFGEEVDFDPGPGNAIIQSTGQSDTDDAFLSILDPNGHFVFARQLGGIGNDLGSSLAVDRWGSILITGGFVGKAGFYPDATATDSITSHGGSDAFLVRWRQCLPTSHVLDTVSCNEIFTSPSGRYIWVADGTYLDTLVNVAGCDSLLTINLTFTILNTAIGVIPELDFLTAVEENATYQWVDCADGYSWIDGETARMFTPQSNGLYAVILDNGICRDTSDCWDWIVAATEDPFSNHACFIFPNPFSDQLKISFSHPQGLIHLALRNLDGITVWQEHRSGKDIEIIDANLNPGLYVLEIKTDAGAFVYKVVKI